MSTPHLLYLTLFNFDHHSGVASVDSALSGDVLADRWNVYAFGSFPLGEFANTLPRRPPHILGECYARCELDASPDEEGFLAAHDIPYSIGKEIRVNASDGRWFFSRETLSP